MLSSAIVLRIPPKLQMTDDEFFEFCQINSELRIERNKSGELLIRPLLVEQQEIAAVASLESCIFGPGKMEPVYVLTPVRDLSFQWVTSLQMPRGLNWNGGMLCHPNKSKNLPRFARIL
jgi:hypothetical protein